MNRESVERAATVDLDRFQGALLGGCYRCGSPVGDGDATIGVHYLVAGRGGRRGRYEWRAFSPALEPRKSELLKQARAGAHLACLACAIRARHGLIEWPDVVVTVDIDAFLNAKEGA
jgi:hypothetical protein